MFELIFLGLNTSECSTQITYNDYERYSNLNSMPPIISYKKQDSLYVNAKSLFPKMRSFSLEEQKKYNAAVKELYKSTGNKLF